MFDRIEDICPKAEEKRGVESIVQASEIRAKAESRD
jgi:hypothetical protein